MVLWAALLSSGLSAAVFWNTWSTSPSTVTGCPCGDPSLFIWFLAWPAKALTSGHSPFFSTSLFFPYGVNLLANTSVVALGIPLIPVTLIFGPIATYNVALFLAPVLTAIGASILARRFARRLAPCLVAGVLFAFSPFVLSGLSLGHLMTSCLAPIPWVVIALDDLFVHPTARPLRAGASLACAVIVEFFLSTEVLLLTFVMTILVLGYWFLRRLLQEPTALRDNLRKAAPGIGLALIMIVAVLAWPAWFAVEGPRHFSGLIWSPSPAGFGGNRLSFFTQAGNTDLRLVTFLSGYPGTPLPGSAYLSASLLIVCAIGTAWLWRDSRARFLTAVGLVAALLSIGSTKAAWGPWMVIAPFGLLGNVLESRFVLFTFLAGALLMAVILDSLADRISPAGASLNRRVLATVAGAVVLLIGMWQVGSATVRALPLAVTKAVTPRWWTSIGPRVSPDAVVLSYPLAFDTIQTAMTWQAQAGLGFSMIGGGGPQGLIHRAGPDAPGMRVLADLSGSFHALPSGTPKEIEEVRRLLTDLRVTKIVVPRSWRPPAIVNGVDPFYAAGFLAASTGLAPQIEAGSWVWNLHRGLGEPRIVSQDLLMSCGWKTSPHRFHAPHCVLSQGAPASGGVARLGRGAA